MGPFIKKDIKFLFIKGLRSSEVRKLILQNDKQIDWVDLGSRAQQYYEVTENSVQVHHITEKQPQTLLNETLIQAIGTLTEKINMLSTSSDDRCFKCGFRGH